MGWIVDIPGGFLIIENEFFVEFPFAKSDDVQLFVKVKYATICLWSGYFLFLKLVGTEGYSIDSFDRLVLAESNDKSLFSANIMQYYSTWNSLILFGLARENHTSSISQLIS